MSHWVSTWGQSHTDIKHMSPLYKDSTMRLAIVNSLEGSEIRLRLANTEGKAPYTVIQAAVGKAQGAQKAVTFAGNPSQTVHVGEEVYSDPIPMEVQPGELLLLSMAFAGKVTSGNGIEECVQCSKKGNFVKARQFATVHKNISACYSGMEAAIPALTSIEVLTEEPAGAIVCFGDSITKQSKWTKPLGETLLHRLPGKLSVINKGIGGNRLLSGPGVGFLSMYGKAGMERFERDVLGEAGTKAVILAIGTNDIGMARSPEKPGWVTAQMLEQGLETLVSWCREKGIRVYGSTILPRNGYGRFLKEAEQERCSFNRWMRTTEIFDGVLDFDAALRDPEKPDCLAFAYDSGDHLHPHALGGKKMAELASVMLLKDFN